MNSIQQVTNPLPESLSPCANVRRSCSHLMKDEPCFTYNIPKQQAKGHNNNNNAAGATSSGTRSVIIDSKAMNDLADKISQSIQDKHKCNNNNNNNNNSNEIRQHNTNDPSTSKKDVDTCINNLDFASWDADGWHYTGLNYSRPNMSKKEEDRHRFERVALYVMIMDCINFCFWPVDDKDGNRVEGMTNLLEYEHLASALKKLAEADDVLPQQQQQQQVELAVDNEKDIDDGIIIKAENSYALAPQNLINLKIDTLLDSICLPKEEEEKNSNAVFNIPNPSERTRLIIELAQSLLSFHFGSATYFISKANKSADTLVHLILQYFPGFRDTAVHNGRWVAFYKRAQILVADLWAALKCGDDGVIIEGKNEKGQEQKNRLDYCCFHDMDKITTFADYRVPQLLRHLGVLQYSPDLARQVDQKIEIVPFCANELYIRAATVVAVDELVQKVKLRLEEEDSKSATLEVKAVIKTDVNAVKMDWYLWNLGEKLDRDDSLGNHHMVKTIFY